MNPSAFEQNGFALFGLPEAFAIDRSALDVAYRRLLAEVHPDRFVSADESEKRWAVQAATLANQRYQILKDPMLRAQYLCELRGFPVDLAESAGVSKAFLSEQMGLHEALEDAISAYRRSGDARALDDLSERLSGARRERFAAIERLLDGEGRAQQAVPLIKELMFIGRLESTLNAAYQD